MKYVLTQEDYDLGQVNSGKANRCTTCPFAICLKRYHKGAHIVVSNSGIMVNGWELNFTQVVKVVICRFDSNKPVIFPLEFELN